MSFRIGLLLLAAAALLPAQKTRFEYDHDATFKAQRRYLWREHPFVKVHPEVREYTVAAQLIQSAINQNLMARGYQPVEEKPEFFVTYFAMAKPKTEISYVPSSMATGAYMWPAGWYAWSPAYFNAWDTEIRNYLQGILLVDIVDATTSKLLWRGIARDKIEEMRTRDKVIEKMSKKVIEGYPPKDAK